MQYENDHNHGKCSHNDSWSNAAESICTGKSNSNSHSNRDSSISIELRKSNASITKEETTSLTINLKGTGNILVVVDSKEVKSANILQLTTEKSTMVNIPSSPQAGKTSITYLSS